MSIITNCADCGADTPTDVHYNTEGNHICDSCHNERYMLCEYSQAITLISEAVTINIGDGSVMVHPHIANKFVQCTDGTWTTRDEAHHHNGVYYNPNTIDNFFFTCEQTGNLTPIDEAIEYDGQRFSKEGYGAYRDVIMNYSTKPIPIFHKMPFESTERNERELWRRNPTYMGFELEVEQHDTNDTLKYCAAKVQDILGDTFYIKSDSSLEDGFECVSHPMTLKYLKKHFTKEMFDSVVQEGVEGDRYNCGMHVHVPRNVLNPLGWWKIGLMVVKCKKYFIDFSRRDIDRLNEYAKIPRLSAVYGDMESVSNKGSRPPQCWGRGAINFQNDNTVEFRLWAGTTNYEHLMNTAQMVDILVEFARVHGWGFFSKNDGLTIWKTFVQFCKGKGLNHFVDYIKTERFKPQAERQQTSIYFSPLPMAYVA